MFCKRCQTEQPTENFYRKSPTGEGRRTPCKSCLSIAAKARTKTPERKERDAQERKRWRDQHPEEAWRAYLKQYGVTPEWYWGVLESQGGGCAICGGESCTLDSRFSVDHDHDCCERVPLCGLCVRGLLCRSCNFGIGNLGDSPEVLEKAKAYLEFYRPKAVCKECGYTLRATRKWLNIGLPTCPCGVEMEEA